MEAQEAFFAKHPDETRNVMRLLLGDIKGKFMFDAGCGYGTDVAHYTIRGAKVWGGDDSKAMIDLAKENHPEISNLFWQETFDDIRLPDCSVDVITSRYALQHQKRIDDAYREFRRVLRPGGEMVLLVAHPLEQLMLKEDKKYHTKEQVSVKIYGELTVVHDFSHTIEEYLSPFMLENFELLHFSEQPADVAAHENEFEDVPDWMLMKWRKKG